MLRLRMAPNITKKFLQITVLVSMNLVIDLYFVISIITAACVNCNSNHVHCTVYTSEDGILWN